MRLKDKEAMTDIMQTVQRSKKLKDKSNEQMVKSKVPDI